MQQLNNFKLQIKGKYELNRFRLFVRGEITRREYKPTMGESWADTIINLAMRQVALGCAINNLGKLKV